MKHLLLTQLKEIDMLLNMNEKLSLRDCILARINKTDNKVVNKVVNKDDDEDDDEDDDCQIAWMNE